MVKIFQERSRRYFGILLLLGLYVAALFLVDFGARQESYQLRVNDVSDLDIVAPRSLIDRAATQRRAEEARNQVPRQMERSQPLSEQALQRLQTFLSILEEMRAVPEGEDPALNRDERVDAAMEASQSKLRAQNLARITRVSQRCRRITFSSSRIVFKVLRPVLCLDSLQMPISRRRASPYSTSSLSARRFI